MVLPSRSVTLVLCTPEDGVLGALPPFEVPTPYWQQTAEVVTGAAERFGLDVTVLRLLTAAQASPPDGGEVSYLAQVATAGRPGPTRATRAVKPWTGADPLADHPARVPYACPGGPQADLAWAGQTLAAAGSALAGRPVQVRTWNLSSLWRLPVTGPAGRPGAVWLKVVPHFFGHEGDLLATLAGTGVTPDVVGSDRGPAGCGRMLLADVPGEDQYGAGPDQVAEFAALLGGLQAHRQGRGADLATTGLPDRSDPDVLVAEANRLLDLVRDGSAGAGRLDPALLDGAARLIGQVPARLARAEAAGSRISLVHGDFHPGNVRGVPGRWTLLDWGDSYLGQPAVDLALATAGFSPAGRDRVLTAAAAGRPDVDLATAVDAVRPLAPLLAALAWQRFLDAIEPDEWPYHEGDPADGLAAAVRAADGAA